MLNSERRREVAVREGRSPQAIDTQIEAKTYEIGVLRGMPRDDCADGFDREPGSVDPTGCVRSIERAGKNPELLFYKIKTNAYKFSWALIPLSRALRVAAVPVQPPLPPLRPHGLRHLFAVLHDAVLVVRACCLEQWAWPSIAGLLFLVPPFHMYRQLKGAYGLGRATRCVRTVLLLVFSLQRWPVWPGAAWT